MTIPTTQQPPNQWRYDCAAAEIERLRLHLSIARQALQAIYDHDDGAWAAGKDHRAAEELGRQTIRRIAGDALRGLSPMAEGGS